MVDLRFHDGLAAVRAFVEAVNGYVTEQEPWKVAKDETQRDRLATILYAAADSLRAIAVLYAAGDADDSPADLGPARRRAGARPARRPAGAGRRALGCPARRVHGDEGGRPLPAPRGR